MKGDFVTIRGERAKWFGPDGSYEIPAAGVTLNNVDSDAGSPAWITGRRPSTSPIR